MTDQSHWIMSMVEDHIAQLHWSEDRTEMEKTLVAGNLRGFASRVRDKMEETYVRMKPLMECSDSIDREGKTP